MKGLLLKDWYSLRNYTRFLLLMLAVYIGISLYMDGGASFAASMLMLVSVMLVNSVFYYDDSAKWDKYAVSLPLARGAIVKARYVFCSILLAGTAIIAFSAGVVVGMLKPQPDWLPTLAITTVVLLAGCTLMSSLYYPIIYKIGAEKGRYVMILLYMVPIFLVTWGLQIFKVDLTGLLAGINEGTIYIAIAAALGASILLLFLSYLVSKRIYARKEF